MPRLTDQEIDRRKVKAYSYLYIRLMVLLRMSCVSGYELSKHIPLSQSHIYRCMCGEDEMKPEHLAASFKVLVDRLNYLNAIVKDNGNCQPKANIKQPATMKM